MLSLNHKNLKALTITDWTIILIAILFEWRLDSWLSKLEDVSLHTAYLLCYFVHQFLIKLSVCVYGNEFRLVIHDAAHWNILSEVIFQGSHSGSHARIQKWKKWINLLLGFDMLVDHVKGIWLSISEFLQCSIQYPPHSQQHPSKQLSITDTHL